MKRTPRKRNKSLYFTSEEGLCFQEDGEVTTHNRFSVLKDYQHYDMEDDMKKEDSSNHKRKKDSLDYKKVKNCILPSYEDFLCNNYYFCNPYFFDNNDEYVISVNDYEINRSCGYFPEFITLDKNNFNKIYDKTNYPRYYPYLFGGRFIKQVSNSKSKYNNQYFSDMKYIHEINKKSGG